MSLGLPAGITTAMAAVVVAAYGLGWMGTGLAPWLVTAIGVLSGAAICLATGSRHAAALAAPLWAWGLVFGAVLAMLIWPVWPALLPPGGASDLTHHLMLVDAIERTRHLVNGASSEAALGEMAHYTPGLHLLVAIAGSLVGVDAYRTMYPLLAITIALKGAFLFLIAYVAAGEMRARLPIALSAVGLVLFAPRAYSLDGFLQAGFFAQVAAELFVVAGWWALARWWLERRGAWMAMVGVMGAAVFLVWPIWIGPLMIAVALGLMCARGLRWRARVQAGALAVAPFAAVAVMHLSQHAAWLGMAGTSGAVPRFVPGPLGWVLIILALAGALAGRFAGTRVTLWFAGGIALQALALWGLAHARGADTAYMAMKMIYLAVYPAAVLGAVGIGRAVQWIPRAATAASWAVGVAVVAVGLHAASASPVPAPLVDVDLDAAGRWARTNLPPACVDYIVDNAEQAYWLHLAVMGQPRSSPRTADIDGYTANRAIGRWLEGKSPPYVVARRHLLPGEMVGDADGVGDAEIVHAFGSAVVIHRRGVACPLTIGD